MKYATQTALNKMSESLSEQFSQEYVSKLDFKKEYKRLETSLSEQDAQLTKNTKATKEQKDYCRDLKKRLSEKADKKDTDRLAHKLQGFASYEDMKELYGKVVPPLAEFEKSM